MSNESNNHEMSAPELLENAARLVERAMRKLDTKSGPCKTCGVPFYHNDDQFIVHRSLCETPDKLRRHATKLRESGRSKANYDDIVLTDA